MQPSPEYLTFSTSWLGYVETLRNALRAAAEDQERPYLLHYRQQLEDSAALLAEAGFVSELQQLWLEMLKEERSAAAARMFLAEVTAYKAATDEVLGQRAPQPTASPKSLWDRIRECLGGGKTVLGSAKDIFKGLPEWAKAILSVAEEIVDLVRGK